MIIKGFYHILMQNHWYSVVNDQLRIIVMSGLYQRCEEINIGCIGTPAEKHLLEMYVTNPYSKFKIKYWSERPEDFEFPTLKLIEEDKSDYVGFYFHAKGVSKPFETIVQHWRAYLDEMVLNRWEVHWNNILGGCDVSSVNYRESPDHFSGNFWWFNRRFIDRLPPVDGLNHNNRWHAEQWCCMAKGNFIYPPFQEPGDAIFTITPHR